MEVFSISGSNGFGQGGCPPGWTATPNGNCGSDAAKYRHPQAVALQQALNSRGAGLSVDGIIGPKTAAAVNRILGTALSPYQIAEQSVALTTRARGAAPGPSPAPPGPQPAPPPMPVPPSITRKFPTGGMVALLGFNLVVSGVGAYFAWE